MPRAPAMMLSVPALLISLLSGPVLAQPVQELDPEYPLSAGKSPAPLARVEQEESRTWELRVEAHGGYGGVTNLSASTGGVQVHGPAVGGALALTWPLSERLHAGVRLGCMVGWGLAGESFHRDESGAPATTDAYGVYAAFQGVIQGRWLTFRFAPGLGVLHLRTEEGSTRDYAGAVSHETTSPEMTLSVGLELNLHRRLALTVSAEAGTLLVRTRGSVLGGVVLRL